MILVLAWCLCPLPSPNSRCFRPGVLPGTLLRPGLLRFWSWPGVFAPCQARIPGIPVLGGSPARCRPGRRHIQKRLQQLQGDDGAGLGIGQGVVMTEQIVTAGGRDRLQLMILQARSKMASRRARVSWNR